MGMVFFLCSGVEEEILRVLEFSRRAGLALF